MDMHSDEAVLTKLSAMTPIEKSRFLCGGRVTVASIQQVKDGGIITSYMPKIRGVVIGNKGVPMFGTEDAARTKGLEIMKKWKAELIDLESRVG